MSDKDKKAELWWNEFSVCSLWLPVSLRTLPFFTSMLVILCLQCFDAVGWAAGRASGLYKNLEWWGTGVVICLERDADLHMAQLMPMPLTVSCFSKIQIGFTFLVPADPGGPGKRAVKRVCVCVCACACACVLVTLCLQCFDAVGWMAGRASGL